MTNVPKEIGHLVLNVTDVARSTAFYRDVLGFGIKTTVPDAPPFVFVWLERDGVPVFLNDPKAVEKDDSDVALRPFGGSATMFFVVTAVDDLHAKVAPHTAPSARSQPRCPCPISEATSGVFRRR